MALHFGFTSKFSFTNVALFCVFAFNMLYYFGFRRVTEDAYGTVILLVGFPLRGEWSLFGYLFWTKDGSMLCFNVLNDIFLLFFSMATFGALVL